MKKLSILAIAVLGVSGAAFAQKKPAQKQPTELECPIMKGHKVNIAKAVKDKMYADYKGRRYVFCCGGCKPAFEKDPAKYAKAESIPVPATPKKK